MKDQFEYCPLYNDIVLDSLSLCSCCNLGTANNCKAATEVESLARTLCGEVETPCHFCIKLAKRSWLEKYHKQNKESREQNV
jgi:hypothetical protein